MIKNDLRDLQLPRERLIGIYRGIVEENDDPFKAGRCRVRVFGVHSTSKVKDKLDGIPTDELPWAQPVLGITEGSITQYGLFSVPLVDSHVFVFFENGNILQPRYFGSCPAISSNVVDWNTGSGTYPHNTVLAVHGGHYIELDSTPGNERINVYHKTGTTILIDKDGNINITGVKDKTETIGGNLSITVTGNISIESTGGNVTIKGARVDINP